MHKTALPVLETRADTDETPLSAPLPRPCYYLPIVPCVIQPRLLNAPENKTFYVFCQNSNAGFFHLKSFLEEGRAQMNQ